MQNFWKKPKSPDSSKFAKNRNISKIFAKYSFGNSEGLDIDMVILSVMASGRFWWLIIPIERHWIEFKSQCWYRQKFGCSSVEKVSLLLSLSLDSNQGWQGWAEGSTAVRFPSLELQRWTFPYFLVWSSAIICFSGKYVYLSVAKIHCADSNSSSCRQAQWYPYPSLLYTYSNFIRHPLAIFLNKGTRFARGSKLERWK